MSAWRRVCLDDTEAGVDQDHGHVGCGRTGEDVAGAAFVPRGVGEDERSPVSREEAVGDIDRDPLIAFGQPVGNCGEIGQPAGVEQQPADQRALAVADRTGCDQAQELALARERCGAHQKYPSSSRSAMAVSDTRSSP